MIVNVSRGSIIRIDLTKQKCLIRCLDGKLWITKTGGGLDYCLESGERYLFSGCRQIVIGVIKEASIEISGEAELALNVSESEQPAHHDLSDDRKAWYIKPITEYAPCQINLDK